MIIFKIVFILLMVLSVLLLAYIQYTKQVRVKNEEIVLGEIDRDTIWQEAWGEVLEETLPYSDGQESDTVSMSRKGLGV